MFESYEIVWIDLANRHLGNGKDLRGLEIQRKSGEWQRFEGNGVSQKKREMERIAAFGYRA
jgi:hypothetical protein